MGSKSQRKKRYQRRRAHAVRPKDVVVYARPGLVGAIEEIVGHDLLPHQKVIAEAVVDAAEQRHAFSSIPTRAKCPECGFSQKVKRDGTMGRHDVSENYRGRTRQCAGTGKKWNST